MADELKMVLKEVLVAILQYCPVFTLYGMRKEQEELHMTI
jgi:hypothetical protein